MKKVLTIVLAALIVAATGTLLAGCGDKKDSKSSKASKTTSATETTEAQTTTAEPETETQTDTEEPSSETEEPSEDDGYISREEAVAKLKKTAGSGAEILDAQKGYTPSGDKAWLITVNPISTDDSQESVIYYVGEDFCFCEDYIPESEALAQVRSVAGSGSKIIDYTKGYTADGKKAWIVTVSAISTDENDNTIVYYVGDGFCYAG